MKRTLTLALLMAAQALAHAQSIGWLDVSKVRHFQQATAGVVTEAPASNPCNYNCPIECASRSEAGPASDRSRRRCSPAPAAAGRCISFQAIWVMGVGCGFSGTAIPITLPPRLHSMRAIRTARYTVTANGASVGLNISPDSYPTPPVLTLTGGTWSEGRYVVDPKQPLTISTGTFAEFGSGADGVIHLFFGRDGRNLGDAWVYRSSGGTNSAFVTIPANTLIDGAEYYLVGYFETVVDINATAIAPTPARAGFQTQTFVRVVGQNSQVFPMTVNSNIGAVTSNATAQIQPRPQDVGTTASVFSFFVAPSTKVLNAATEKGAKLAVRAEGEKAASVECVLAQLNSTGQLPGRFGGEPPRLRDRRSLGPGPGRHDDEQCAHRERRGNGALRGLWQERAGHADVGLNQRAVTIPGEISCDPKAPQTGWWWSAGQDGRGYSIEVAGNHIFYASYLYELNGRATWYVASGNTSLDGSLFTGNLEAYSRGQTLGGAYRVRPLR
jgi:hypothetical protein